MLCFCITYSSIIKKYRSVKFSRRFGGTYRPTYSGSKLALCFMLYFCMVYSSILKMCRSVKFSRRFGGTYRHHIEGQSLMFASCRFLSWLSLRPWICIRYVPPKRRSTFIGLRGVTIQNIEVALSVYVCDNTVCPLRARFVIYSCCDDEFWDVTPCSLVHAFSKLKRREHVLPKRR
jgi:hypothetical protein